MHSVITGAILALALYVTLNVAGAMVESATGKDVFPGLV